MKLNRRGTQKRLTFESKVDGRTVSIVELLIIPDLFGGKPAGYVHKVYTDGGFQKQGRATEMLGAALRRAKELDCHKVFLVCNEETVPFYEARGFKRDQVEMVVRFG